MNSKQYVLDCEKAKALQFQTCLARICYKISDGVDAKPGSVFTNHSQEHRLSFSTRFTSWNITQPLIGYTVRFSQSEVVLHSNT